MTIEWASLVADGAQHPLGVERHRQEPRSTAPVGHPQYEELHRVVRRHERGQLGDKPVPVLDVGRVAGPVADGGRRVAARGQRSGGPERPGLLVAQVHGFARRVADGVVAPRRQPVRLAVPDPGEAEPGVGRQAPGERVGDDVGPRGRRGAGDHVLAAVRSESAGAVGEQQRAHIGPGAGRWWRRAAEESAAEEAGGRVPGHRSGRPATRGRRTGRRGRPPGSAAGHRRAGPPAARTPRPAGRSDRGCRWSGPVRRDHRTVLRGSSPA